MRLGLGIRGLPWEGRLLPGLLGVWLLGVGILTSGSRGRRPALLRIRGLREWWLPGLFPPLWWRVFVA